MSKEKQSEEIKVPLLQNHYKELETYPEQTLYQKTWTETKKLWRVVGPAIFSRITSYSMFVITQAFTGHLGDLELAAMSIVTNVILGFNFGLMLGMASALETLCGQAFGAKRYYMLGIYLQRSWIVLSVCCVVMLPMFFYTTPILKLLGQPDDVAELSGVVVLCFIPLHFSFAIQFPLQRFLQSQLKNSVIAYMNFMALMVHIFLSWVVVYKLQLGVMGAALVLNVSWWMVVLGLFIYTVCGGCPLTWTGFSMEAFSGLWEFLKLSASSGVMLCLENWYYRILIVMTGNLENAKIAVDALSVCMSINGWEMMIPLAFFAGKGNMKATTVSNQGSIRSFLSKRKAASISEKQSILIVGTSNKRDEQPILNIGTSNTSEEQPTSNVGTSNMHHEPLCKSRRIEVDLSSLARDPALRSPIWKYDVNQRDEIRRAYIKMGPYQPILPKFPATQSGKQNRRFQSRWYKQFTWLEYSPLKDKVFCFPCFLFENELAHHSTFTTQGFSNWKRVNDGDNCACLGHVGGINSPHCKAMKGIDDLLNVNRHIEKLINEQSIEEKRKNRLRLTTSIESVRLLSMQGCAFRGHDESPSSNNRGNMIEVIKSYGRMDPNIKAITLENAPQNAQYVTSKIQKDILHVFAQRIRNKIREEVGEANFCILVDEARDVSDKEQMAIVLRFVDVNGFVKERFFAIVEVEDTIATTLKKEVSDALGRFNLNIKDLRGQGYDGASNMRGIWNGLQALFLRDSPSAYYVHCFAHRLQLALVAACEKEESIWKFFSTLNCIVNLITVSPKRQTQLRSAQAIEIANMVANGERETGKGANQVGGLRRAGKTRWSSHFESICSVIDMYGSVITVLEFIRDECSTSSRTGVNMRNEAKGCLREMRSFKFIFVLYLMHRIMAITDLLCRALQHKALDIVNAMSLVKSTKELLQGLRDNSFDIVLTHVESICPKFGIAVPNMDDLESDTGRSCQQQDGITWRHYFQFEVFNSAIDFQVEELNSRFNDDTVELLTLSSALEPKDNFSSLDVDKIYTLAAKFYSDDFSEQDLRHLSSQLIHYQKIMPTHVKFQDLTTISELCRRLVETNLKQQFNMIDRLVRLVLTLPVSTASAERIFSSLKNVKTDHRNKMGEEFLADSLMIYVEREIAESIDNETIISDFYEMKERRAQV